MDRDLRRIYRELLADPGNPETSEALRGALARAEGEVAAPLRDELLGTYFATNSWENCDLEESERRHPARAHPTLLAPLPPLSVALRWRAPGSLLALTHGAILVEAASGALRALDLRDGRVRWEVPSLLGEVRELEGSEGRRERLGWAAAPWGAVELVAEFDAPLTYRRRGRYHAELGRVTERSPEERLEGGARLLLQVALPAPSWREPPELIREGSEPGEGLCESELSLSEWGDSLYELQLDPSEPTFSLRTLEQGEGEGHAFEIRRGRDAPRVDPVPWDLFPSEEGDPREDAFGDLQREVLIQGPRRWELDFQTRRLSSEAHGGSQAWSLDLSDLSRGDLDLVPFQDQLWVLGLGSGGGTVFQRGADPRPLDLALALDGRRIGRDQGARGYALEGILLLQGGSEEVVCLG